MAAEQQYSGIGAGGADEAALPKRRVQQAGFKACGVAYGFLTVFIPDAYAPEVAGCAFVCGVGIAEESVTRYKAAVEYIARKGGCRLLA